MTQSQRRKDLSKAKATVRRLEDEIARFEPLTAPMRDALGVIATVGGGVVTAWFDRWGIKTYRVGDSPKGVRVSKVIVWSLERREILPERPNNEEKRVKATYCLTDWGKKQAEALTAKAEKVEGVL